MIKYLFLILISFFAVSCKTNTATKPTSTETPSASTKFLLNKIQEKPNFQNLKINSRVDVETGNFIPTLDATIYLEKDQKVWMNMVAVFLNVGRGIATPTGIKGYEKWNKTYIESDFTYLNNLLQVNFIDFSSLQNLLLGKTFIPLDDKNLVITNSSEGYRVVAKKPLEFQTQGKTSKYSVTMDFSTGFDLMTVNLNNIGTNEKLTVTYSNWVDFENIRLPKNVKLSINGTKTSQILLENTRFESSKMETPYSVPNNYMKTEIR